MQQSVELPGVDFVCSSRIKLMQGIKISKALTIVKERAWYR